MSATMMAAPTSATKLNKSNLTSQLERDDGSLTPKHNNKSRSLSDAPKTAAVPTLSPSPAIRESPVRRASKDDNALTDPVTPRRPAYHMRGLSLQMPTKHSEDTSIPRIPLSPKLDSASTYGSPASVLPRRSRGLDFARACTNLHHSTLAESSPDASPITGRGIQIPQRRGIHNSTIAESPNQNWTSVYGERTNLSSSVSSINMLDTDTDSDDSSVDMAVDRDLDDPMLNTPAASRLNALAVTHSPGMDWLNNPQPTNAQFSLLNFQPNRMSFRKHRGLRNTKSSQSSSSVSMRSSKPSPGPLSPPIRPSVETSGYFNLTRQQVRSRRESLSLGTDDLVLSDSEWDGDNKMNNGGTSSNDGSSERGVIRRAVTRRSNLLPKTKGFARIRAALMEESDPLQSEARRESEVIKQVQESDEGYNTRSTHTNHNNITDSVTTAEPLETSIEAALSKAFAESTSNNHIQDTARDQSTPEPFSKTAKRHSGGLGFWNTFEHTPPNNIDRYRTPPPPSLIHSDTNASDDTMISVSNSTSNTSTQVNDPSVHSSSSYLMRQRQLQSSRSRSRSTTPLASQAAIFSSNNPYSQTQTQPPTAGDVARKVNNKRRRDDDFDPASFKRRAVSPGMMSAQSSPVVPQSPTLTTDKDKDKDRLWGRPPAKAHGDRSNSGSSVREGPGSAGGGGSGSAGGLQKRVGLQGMTEANDGFMSMSID